MKHLIRSFVRDEKGNVILMVGVLLAILLVFSVWAIDMGQTTLVRTQLQNAADAGALAGAFAYGPQSDTAGAVTAAMLAANANDAIVEVGGTNEMASAAISAGDVTFPEPGRVRVTTHRTEATNDAFQTYFLRIFRLNDVGEMTAKATAGFAWVCGSRCLKPWAVPDRWCDSAGTGDCDNGNGIYEPELGEYYDPETTGYQDADAGDTITIVPDPGQGGNATLAPQHYNAVRFPPVNRGTPEGGNSVYRSWIAGCRDQSVVVQIDDILEIQPGAAASNPPAFQLVRDIIQSDPSATWDEGTQTVINSAFTISPRIVKFALIDTDVGLIAGTPQSVKVVKIAVLFLQTINTGTGRITGRFMYLADPDGVTCEDQSTPSYLYKTVLVE